MIIYNVTLDLTLVMGRLKNFRLGEFNSLCPTVFTEASNPDDACYFTICKFSDTILKQKETASTAILLKDILYDIRITRVRPKNA
jgi:hypothetical protein